LAFIEIRSLAYSIAVNKNEKKTLLDKIEYSIEQDDCIVLIGGNGVGKTTLTKLMIGVLKPQSGCVCIDGKNVLDYKRFEVGKKIGYLFQNPELQLFNASVKEELLFSHEFGGGISPQVLARYDAVVESLSLKRAEKTTVKQLSQGEKQRLAIGTILMNDPQFIILDEPTVGLDAQRKDILLGILTQLHAGGTGLFIVSHDTAFLKTLTSKALLLTAEGILHEQEL